MFKLVVTLFATLSTSACCLTSYNTFVVANKSSNTNSSIDVEYSFHPGTPCPNDKDSYFFQPKIVDIKSISSVANSKTVATYVCNADAGKVSLKLAGGHAVSIFKGETSGCTGKRYEVKAITVKDEFGTVSFSGLKMEEGFSKHTGDLFILEY